MRLSAVFLTAALFAACGPSASIENLSVDRSTVGVDRAEGVRADGQDVVTITVTLLTDKGVPVVGVVPTVVVSGSGNVLSALAATDDKGESRATLRSTVAEAKEITAAVKSGATEKTLSAKPTVGFVAGDAVKLAFAAGPSSTQAGETLWPAVEVRIEDAQGNAVPGATAQVTMALEAGPEGAELQGTLVLEAVNGLAAFGDLQLAVAGEGYQLRASADGLEPAVSEAFTISRGTPVQLRFQTQPSDAVAGQALSVSVALEDASGNLVTDAEATVALSLGTNPGGATLSGTATAPLQGGIAVFTGVAVEQAGTGYTLTASSSGYMSDTSAPFTISAAAPSGDVSTLVIAPQSVVADGVATATVTLQLRDAYSNPIADVPVALGVDGTAGTLSPEQGSTDGSGTFVSTLSSTVAEEKRVQASVAGFSLSATVVFVAGPPSSLTSVVSASPAAVAAGDATVVTVLLRDANGNPVANEPVSFSSAEAGDFSQPNATTDANGEATTSFSSTVAETKTLIASFAGGSVSTTVAVTPGMPDGVTSTLVASPASAVADGSSSTTVTLVARDAHGNVVPGIAVTLSASGTANAFTPASGVTDGSGEFTAALSSTVAETKTITASFGAATASAQVTFVAGAPVSAGSTFAASPATISSSGTSTLTVTLVDAHGNLVPNAAVSFSATGGGNTFAPSTGTTDANGQLTADFSSTVAEAKTLTASFGSETLTAPVTVTAGAPSSATSTLTASPTSVPADGTTTSAITVVVQDAHGNPVSGASVSLSASGTGQAFVPATGTTDATGTFLSAVTSTTAETKTVTADIDGGALVLTAQVTFSPTHYTLAVSFLGSGSVESSPAGIACGTACSATFPAGDQIVLTATPADATWQVGSWTGCTSSSNTTCTVDLNQNTSVSVEFVQTPFDWVNACQQPNMVRHFASRVDDAITPAMTIPFTFNFHGTPFTQVVANSNGYLGFGSANTSYSNGALPTTSAVADAIFPFWDDLMTRTNEGICHATIGSPGSQRFVVTWSRMVFYPEDDTAATELTFSVILDEGTNQVRVSYMQLVSPNAPNRALGDSATVGIQSSTGVVNQFSLNQAALAEGLTLTF